MNPCIFVSVCNMFLFSFSSRVKLNIATDTWADFFAASSIVKKSLLPHVLKEILKNGVQSFYIAIQQDPSCSETVHDWSFVTEWLWKG